MDIITRKAALTAGQQVAVKNQPPPLCKSLFKTKLSRLRFAVGGIKPLALLAFYTPPTLTALHALNTVNLF